MYDSGMVHKVQKAKRYAEEPERIHIRSLSAEIEGDNQTHRVEFEDGHWRCDCGFFGSHHTCSHVMALDRLLGPVRPEEE